MIVMNENAADSNHNQPPIAQRNRRGRAIFWLTFFMIIIGVVWFLFWFFYLQYHESTDDAYVNGNMTNVTSVMSGTPVAFFADNTDFVQEGQLLVLLDDTLQKIEFEKECATLAATVLQVAQLYENVTSNKANVENKRIALKKAQYDYENRKQLIDSQAVSNEEFTHAQDDLSMAQQALQQAEAQLKSAMDAAGNTSIASHPSIEIQKASLRQAYYNLRHCAIYAPATGYVAQRKVEVGQWITPTTFLMAIIPLEHMWVDANYKETELTYMRIGQPATLTFDIYGSRTKFDGKVVGIASGTGSVFSIIPPQNATGNWIKIVQRLPVKIEINPDQIKKFPLRLGISAYVNVDITNTDLPRLAQIPPKNPVAVTRVFEIDLKPVEILIDKIIKENLATGKYEK